MSHALRRATKYCRNMQVLQLSHHVTAYSTCPKILHVYGLNSSGSVFKGQDPPRYRQLPRKPDPEDLSL